MFKEGAKCDVFTPILQIIDASQVKHGINIIISDSSEFTQALLRDYPCSAQEVIELKFKIIKLNNYHLEICQTSRKMTHGLQNPQLL